MDEYDPDYVRQVRMKQLDRIVKEFGRVYNRDLPAFNDVPGSASDPAQMVINMMTRWRVRRLVIIEDGIVTLEI